MKRLQQATKPTASQAYNDPWLRLCGAVAKRAVADLGSNDPTVSLDALDWFLGDDAYLFLRGLGFAVKEDEVFYKAVMNGTS